MPQSPSVEQLAKELEAIGEHVPMSLQGFQVRALLYGHPGCGKTDLAAQIVRALGGNTCLVYADSAWTTILKHPDVAAKTWKYPFQGFSMINSILNARKADIEPFASFDNLIWDTWSTSVDKVLRSLVDKRKYPKEQHDPEVEGWPHYRLVERLLIDLVDELNKSDMNIIYTAHLREPTEKDKEAKHFAIRPAAPMATFNVLARESNCVGWIYKDAVGDQRKIQLSGTRTEIAKCQIPGIVEDTYTVNKFIELLTNERNK